MTSTPPRTAPRGRTSKATTPRPTVSSWRSCRRPRACELPTLAICRGAQLLAVAHGGSLNQRPPATEGHRVLDGLTGEQIRAARHEVDPDGGISRCRRCTSVRRSPSTPSTTIRSPTPESSPSARRARGSDRGGGTADGSWPCLGVQWHPEKMAEPEQRGSSTARRPGARAGARGWVSLHGYTAPLSPDGRAGIVPPPPWHYSGDFLIAEYRTDPGRRGSPAAGRARAGRGSRRGRRDLRRLAVVLGRPPRARRPDPVSVPRVLPRRRRPLPGPAGEPLRLHLGRQGLCHVPRLDPGLSQEARLDPHDTRCSPPARRRRGSPRAPASAPPAPPTTGRSPGRW